MNQNRLAFLFQTIAICVLLTISSCSVYSSDFYRIENTKLRILGVRHFPNPDVAPGDTVTARIYFAGSPVVNVDNFTISFKSIYGVNGISFIEKPLDIIATDSWLPDSFQYSFVISSSIFLDQKENLSDTSNVDTIMQFMNLPHDEVVSQLTLLSGMEREKKVNEIQSLNLQTYLFFSASTSEGVTIKSKSDVAVRYNTKLTEFLNVNHNPTINWMAVFKVPRSVALGFDPFAPQSLNLVSRSYLFNSLYPDSVDTVVVIDTGFSYFLVSDNGVISTVFGADTLLDLDRTRNGELLHEEYIYKWFFQNKDLVSENFDSLLLIDEKALGPCVEFSPPLALNMLHFKMWVVVYDQLTSTRWYRPRGIAIKGVSGVFWFSDAFRQQERSLATY